MSEKKEDPLEEESNATEFRCPQCDSVVSEHAPQCIMCGAELDPTLFKLDESPSIETLPSSKTEVPKIDEPVEEEGVEEQEEPTPNIKPVKVRKKSKSVWWLTIIVTVFTIFFSLWLLLNQDSELTLALVPTETLFPPTMTYTPTATPFATGTEEPTETPQATNTPLPTDTPRPPRYHSVALGETLFGISLFYRISAESIAEGNEIPVNSQIQVGQQLLVPWPTATPPLESIVLDINGENVVADVTDCEIVTIQEGDSAYGLSAQKGVPAAAIVAVNRLTEESIQLLHPGDTLCVPRIVHSDTLPPTPGPAPSATSTSYPPGPNLLYPIEGADLDAGDQALALQWVAVKDLTENEWYMVELMDMDALDALPFRAFTRDTSFHLPSSWRPTVPELHQMRWRVSIVQVTGQREDGEFIYTFGGQNSSEATFNWLGAEPTATPTSTSTPTITPTP